MIVQPKLLTNSAIQNPILKFMEVGALSGVDQLNPELTINSITVEPILRYKGGDATTLEWPAWAYGQTLPIQVVGVSPTINSGSPLLGANDDSVKFNASDFYRYSDNSFGDITTEDFVIEIVFKASVSTTYGLLNKRLGNTNGYSILNNSGPLQGQIRDGTNVATPATATLIEGAWYHAIIFYDRSGSAQWYVNGAASGAAVAISTVGSLTTPTVPFSIGVYRDDVLFNYNQNIAYVAIWKRSNWLDTHLQASVAMERFTRLCGVYPKVARGTGVPTTNTRASLGTLRKHVGGVTKLYTVGANWPRLEQLSTIRGHLNESAVTNLCLQSEDFATTWALGAAAISANAIAAPDGNTTADGIVSNGADSGHHVRQSITLTAATYTFSAFVKKGNKDWVLLENQTINNGAYFNIATGATGSSVGVGVIEKFIESYGNDWYRIGYSFTGTAVAHDLRIYPAHADGDATFAGDTVTISTYVWGAQVELRAVFTSYIKTTTASAARSADSLRFDDANNIDRLKGSIICSFLTPNYNNPSALAIWSYSNGAQTNRCSLAVGGSGDTLQYASVVDSSVTGLINGTTDTTIGTRIVTGVSYIQDNMRLYVNGASQGTDLSGALPTADPDTICFGDVHHSASIQLDGIIEFAKVYAKPGMKL